MTLRIRTLRPVPMIAHEVLPAGLVLRVLRDDGMDWLVSLPYADAWLPKALCEVLS